MTFYIDESQIWKCPKHPSRRRRNGICAKCLRDRLVTLCPNCANARPCNCCPPSIDSSTTSSNSFSLFSFSRGTIESNIDPILHKSRSVAPAFLRLRSKHVENNKASVSKASQSKINFWSMFSVNKSKKYNVDVDGGIDEELNKGYDLAAVEDSPMMIRSRSVAVGTRNDLALASKAFRQPKQARAVAVAVAVA